jgi:hypothetical protein
LKLVSGLLLSDSYGAQVASWQLKFETLQRNLPGVVRAVLDDNATALSGQVLSRINSTVAQVHGASSCDMLGATPVSVDGTQPMGGHGCATCLHEPGTRGVTPSQSAERAPAQPQDGAAGVAGKDGSDAAMDEDTEGAAGQATPAGLHHGLPPVLRAAQEGNDDEESPLMATGVRDVDVAAAAADKGIDELQVDALTQAALSDSAEKQDAKAEACQAAEGAAQPQRSQQDAVPGSGKRARERAEAAEGQGADATGARQAGAPASAPVNAAPAPELEQASPGDSGRENVDAGNTGAGEDEPARKRTARSDAPVNKGVRILTASQDENGAMGTDSADTWADEQGAGKVQQDQGEVTASDAQRRGSLGTLTAKLRAVQQSGDE